MQLQLRQRKPTLNILYLPELLSSIPPPSRQNLRFGFRFGVERLGLSTVKGLVHLGFRVRGVEKKMETTSGQRTHTYQYSKQEAI